jgi:hypothetical protein
VFSLRLFSFRSSERNQESDERRLAQISRAVRLAAVDAEAEARGLRARIAKARKAAIFLTDIDGSRPNRTRRTKLKELEQLLLAAEARLAQLRDHLAHLQRIETAASGPSTNMT